MLNKAVINLSAIRENALAVKRLLPETTKFCAVVKADAYGHGAEKVSAALYNIVDSFAVALPEEGVALRRSGIDKDVLVLTRAQYGDAETAARFGLTLTAAEFDDLALFNAVGEKTGAAIKTHIKFNTGMNRQGFSDLSEISAALKFCAGKKGVKIEGLYSHYARPENDVARKKATNLFLLAKRLVKGYNKNAMCHISASGGTLKGEFFDMVRIGILLYGYKPYKTDDITVRPAMKIFAPVICERTLAAGETALYGDCRAKKKTRFSLVRYGYADGLPRRSARGVFNNRCMDVTAYERGGVLAEETFGDGCCGLFCRGVSEPCKDNLGAENGGIKLFNVLPDADVLAGRYGTISYEILTKAAVRAEKIYTD